MAAFKIQRRYYAADLWQYHDSGRICRGPVSYSVIVSKQRAQGSAPVMKGFGSFDCQWPLENPQFWPRKVPTVPIPHLELTLVTRYRAC